jgi:peptidoglycan/LPS O-acetylase OafA/YrhL
MSIAVGESPVTTDEVGPKVGPIGDPIDVAIARDNSTASPHLGWIDALRGWAFLGVLVCHVSQKVGGSLPGWLGFWASSGRFGVQLFYIVSCVTLFMSLDSRMHREARPIAAFFIRRFFRIAPLFWLAIIFYNGVLWHESAAWAPHGVSTADIVSNVIFLHGWHLSSIDSVVPGGWSIAVEMNFYLLLPILFLWVTNLRRAVWCAAVFLLLSVGADRFLTHVIEPHVATANLSNFFSFRQFWLPSQLPIFALGAMLFHILRLPQMTRGNGRSTAILLAMIALFLVASGPSRFVRHDMTFALALFLGAWAIALQPVKLLVNRVTRYLGKISFSGYLTHTAVILLTMRLLYHGSPQVAGLGNFAILLVASLILTVIFSTVTYQLVEAPGQAIGKWLIARTVNRTTPAVAGAVPITLPQLSAAS